VSESLRECHAMFGLNDGERMKIGTFFRSVVGMCSI